MVCVLDDVKSRSVGHGRPAGAAERAHSLHVRIDGGDLPGPREADALRYSSAGMGA